MFNLVLYQPEIPPNTGNIIRLCANTGCRLHLVQPLGFDLDHARLKRAGLDYHEYAKVRVHSSWEALQEALGRPRMVAFSTSGTVSHADFDYAPGDALVLGPETRGLPREILQELPASHCLRVPMLPGQRSLNLSNAAAVVVYEAWRQQGFAGARKE